MKKVIFAIVVVFMVLVGAVLISLKQEPTTLPITYTWELTSQQLKDIEIYGSKQPINIYLRKGEGEKTTLSLSGKVSEHSKQLLDHHVEQSTNSIFIPLSKRGFSMTLSAIDKADLEFTITLSKKAELERLNVDTLVGDVFLSVPNDFDGHYLIHDNSESDIINIPETSQTADTVIEIDGYGKITVEKE